MLPSRAEGKSTAREGGCANPSLPLG